MKPYESVESLRGKEDNIQPMQLLQTKKLFSKISRVMLWRLLQK